LTLPTEDPDCRRTFDLPLPRYRPVLCRFAEDFAAPLPMGRRNRKNLSPFIESVNGDQRRHGDKT
jgi:hypothetical protein